MSESTARPDAGPDAGRDAIASTLRAVVAALPGGGEVRPGQAAMAEAVAAAIARRGHLVVQAGTGTGKSIGYLVPALLSGTKVVVATATKALQDQLAHKDLPFLAAHLPDPFSHALLKGRSNYFCWQRAREVATDRDEQLALDGAARESTATRERRSAETARIIEWAGRSDTGDRAELDFEPSAPAWAAVSVTAAECPGANRCPSGEVCFAEKARQRAHQADVVVVNTHLYGQHIRSGGFVLPDHEVVVFDEAHALEDVMAESLGLDLGGGRLAFLAARARAVVSDLDRAVDLGEAADRLSAALEPWVGQRLASGPGGDPGIAAVLVMAADRVQRALALLRAVPDSDNIGPRKVRAIQAAGALADDLQEALALHAGARESGIVSWVESVGPQRTPVLRIAPVDVGPALLSGVWAETSAILTSATVPPALVERLALPRERTTELDVGSPFDYAAQSLLYCATHLPDPRAERYASAMHEELRALLAAAGGRTLALFTSWKAMQAAAESVRSAGPPFRVLTQSDLPKPALTRVFQEDETSVLFATMGFWQGIDVPGRSLTMVVIDRIPFPRPDEPLTQARRDRAGPEAFRVVDIPRAATLLAQGAGRLIRSRADRGVVAVLDPRLNSAGYRWELIRALPPMRRTRHRRDVEAFLAAVLAPVADT